MRKIIWIALVLAGSFVHSLAHPPWGIDADSQRNIYFADLAHNGNGTIWKFSHKGELIPLIKDFHAHNVTLDDKGHPVAASGDERGSRLVRILGDKQLETIIGIDNNGDFHGGSATYSKKGNIFFSVKKDNRFQIWQYHKAGEITLFNNYKFEWIQSIYVDDDEYIYAVDKAVNNGTLYKLSKEGSAELLATNLITKLDTPVDIHDVALLGITKGCDGHIYITESVGKRVVKINSDKTTKTFYKSEGDWFPTGIDFFAGDAYVLEYKTSGKYRGPRIIKITETGEKIQIFDYNQYKKSTQEKTGSLNKYSVWTHIFRFLAKNII